MPLLAALHELMVLACACQGPRGQQNCPVQACPCRQPVMLCCEKPTWPQGGPRPVHNTRPWSDDLDHVQNTGSDVPEPDEEQVNLSLIPKEAHLLRAGPVPNTPLRCPQRGPYFLAASQAMA